MAAFSDQNALRIARHSNLLRLLITTLQAALVPPITSDAEEAVAAIANFARCGITFQAYIRKHSGLAVLAPAAQQDENSTIKFHACRALAEFSRDNKWLVLLIADGCISIMLSIIDRDSHNDTLSEAVRFLGNLATSSIGRESIIASSGVERIMSRIVSVCYPRDPKARDLTIDLLRAASNLCVNCKTAAQTTVDLGGIALFIEAYGFRSDEPVQTEAFRGLLILAQGGQGFRASVLREIGVKIRQDASQGLCVAHLYDLSRRIKVEASTERADDFPQTIAGLGARSKQYLFEAGPLSRTGTSSSHTPNSVPDMKSPGAAVFRQSGRLLSVQRPVLHRDRLEYERRQRVPPQLPSSSVRSADGDNVSLDYPPQQRRSRPEPREHRKHSSRSDSSRSHGDISRVSDTGGTKPRVMSEPDYVESIPRCKVIENKNNSGRKNWVAAAWSAACNAVTRPPNSALTASVSSDHDVDGNSEETNSVTSGGNDIYEMGVPLGRGGFATVYLAKNLRSGELVAVKRFHPLASCSPNAKKKAELAVRRAIKEQRIWDGLSHKNIVSYRGCFFGENSELNLVAEYIPGWSLADHLSQVSKFPEHMVACITQQIVAGLDYLHKCGITHRDVKPANILVNPDGVIKITDFGVSSAVDVPTMTGNTLVGTPWYIAPEMIEGRPYGKSVDIWSLGCTVLELATGRRPYHYLRPHVALFRMTQDRMPPIPKHLSAVLRDFLRTCWVWDPAQRPTPAHLKRHPFLASVVKPEITNLKNLTRET